MKNNEFTVGELSKLTGVSKQAIRYYGRIGLLKSGSIDKQNGYRYYEPIHLIYLNTIMRLSQLGCSLKETEQYLYGGNLKDVKRMLEKKGGSSAHMHYMPCIPFNIFIPDSVL